MKKEDVKNWLSNRGYGSGTNLTIETVAHLLIDFASQSKPQLNIEKVVSGIVDSLGEPSNDNDYHIHSVNGNRWITHNEVGSGEPLKQWLKSEIEKHIEQSKPEEIEWIIHEIEKLQETARLANKDDFKDGYLKACVNIKAIITESELQNRIKPVDTKTVDAVEFAEWIAGCGYDRFYDDELKPFWHDGNERIANTTQELLNLYIESKK